MRFPRVPGYVKAVASDEAGGWFIGGSFDKVGARRCRYLAHVEADGQLDPKWCRQVDGRVSALAIEGDRLYVGGSFLKIAGAKRRLLAAFNRTSAQILAWNPLLWAGPIDSKFDPRQGDVYSLAASPRTVYVSGRFERVGSVKRRNLVALDAVTAKATGFIAVPSKADWSDHRVEGMVVHGRRLYVAGRFDGFIGGRARSIAALDIETGRLAARFATHFDVAHALLFSRNLYVTGSRNNLPAVRRIDARTGRESRWRAHFLSGPECGGGEIWGAAASAHDLYLAGCVGRPTCSVADECSGMGLIAIDQVSGNARPSWRPDLEGTFYYGPPAAGGMLAWDGMLAIGFGYYG
jgi:hypothetical protein